MRSTPKRLKAIAVRGTIPVKIAHPEGLTAIAKWVSSTMVSPRAVDTAP